MEAAEQGNMPELIILQSKNTEASSDKIYSGRIVFDETTSSYEFILYSDKVYVWQNTQGIKNPGLMPISINHN